uniref:Reverse transcriptase domain-containing protein n=1 Tax=Haemonchus contortus TaxID=6289 RepID=A0A7I4YNL0_HAECO
MCGIVFFRTDLADACRSNTQKASKMKYASGISQQIVDSPIPECNRVAAYLDDVVVNSCTNHESCPYRQVQIRDNPAHLSC